ncbi:DUF4238 domain-containing protein [Silicimonas algicola]|uniref:Uncharacterized protein DUF4238 n=1 Tax=Silicimonas algicola TaxID=1826607 RepID=A0A316GBF2_9RHOB|nr:DUF4238 domain-containing protein [Silicimonas algicola]AZQ67320.1 DUF4238 domain-containing protein [Silicimonas algicola]PWK57000.1 uncharacterized protein DUF4238 [Silicimonas algicola]
MPQPKKHHYIPSFYLKRWAGVDDRICEFSRPWKTQVRPRRVHPNATGYQLGLYSFLYSSEPNKQTVEERFFKDIDDKGASSLFELENNKGVLSRECIKDFSRFIISLEIRCPEDIARLRKDWTEAVYVANRAEPFVLEKSFPFTPATDKVAQAGVEHSMYSSLKEVMEAHAKSYEEFNWRVISLPETRLTLLTSDRPLLRTYSTRHHFSTFLLPLGPRTCLLGYRGNISPHAFLTPHRKRKQINQDIHIDGEGLVRFVNMFVTENAVKYVFATDDKQLVFVNNRISKRHYPRLSDSFADYFSGMPPRDFPLPHTIEPHDFVGLRVTTEAYERFRPV